MRRLLPVATLVVLGGVLVLLWKLRAGPPSPEVSGTSGRSAGSAPEVSGTSGGGPKRVSGAAAQPEAADASAGPIVEKTPIVEDEEVETPQRRMRTVPRRLKDEAARCGGGGGVPDEGRLMVGYTMVVSGGAVSFQDVKVTTSTMGSPALELCVTESIAGFRFRDELLAEGSKAGTVSISTLDLTRRQR